MKLLDIAMCARPVLFLIDDAKFPLSIGGTGIVVVFRGLHFVITAKHVLNLSNFNSDQFRVQYRPDVGEFIPLKTLSVGNPGEDIDADQYDLAAWEIDGDAFQEHLFGEYRPYHLKSIDRMTIFSARSAYIYKGYPFDTRRVDFDNRHFAQDGVTTRAEYIGKANYEGVHELRLLNFEPLESINGMSGSPVFQVNNDPNGIHSSEAFAGMLIRGSLDAGRAYFLEHRKIIGFLESAVWHRMRYSRRLI